MYYFYGYEQQQGSSGACELRSITSQRPLSNLIRHNINFWSFVHGTMPYFKIATS